MLGDPQTQHDLGKGLGLGVIWTDVADTYGQMVLIWQNQALDCVN